MMMKPKINPIESLFSKNRNETSLANLILNYASLKQKIENTNEYSWYFKRGLDSNLKKLAALSADFERIRKLFNEANVDFFLQKIAENDAYLIKLEGKYKSFSQRILYSWKISNIQFLKELIQLKSNVKTLKPIDYYLENPEVFLKTFDLENLIHKYLWRVISIFSSLFRSLRHRIFFHLFGNSKYSRLRGGGETLYVVILIAVLQFYEVFCSLSAYLPFQRWPWCFRAFSFYF